MGAHGSAPLLSVGLLNVHPSHFVAERRAGLNSATLIAGWNEIEPAPGDFSADATRSLVKEILTARHAGLGVSLDPGIQYAPDWVFKLAGGTRFVDQYGDVYRGPQGSGDEAPNAVTDPVVRAALTAYLAYLGAHIPAGTLSSVRVGGGTDGELKYPGANYAGHTNCWWAYDSSTQARSPVPGWRPGTGTVKQATAFLRSYNDNLDAYGAFLDATVKRDFQTETLLVLPGWGERPGVARAEARSLLTLNAEEFNFGSDWRGLVERLPTQSGAVLYTTWLDAPNNGTTTELMSPIAYLARLARRFHLALGGENTGGGAARTYELCLRRALTYRLTLFNWMDERAVVGASRGLFRGPTFGNIRADLVSLGSST